MHLTPATVCLFVLASTAFGPRAAGAETRLQSVQPDSAARATAASRVTAARLSQPIVVDGALDEAAWQQVSAITAFTQRDPVEGAAPTESTLVRVAYDDEAIYVGAWLYDSAPDSIVARLGRRDADTNADRFTVYLDPYRDGRTGFFFWVNAAGSIGDGILLNDDWDDDSWDGVWEARVRRDAHGWTAEFRIPYSQLRFHDKDRHVWGVNFRREIARKNESDYLVFTPKGGSGFVSRFAELVGIDGIAPPRRLEVRPYLTTKAAYTRHDAGDPFNDGSTYSPGIGVDLKVGLGSNLTLDATINPDFGQVEVDPAVVNLSDVETYFQEKRPFFVEGSSIFDFGRGGSNSFWGFNWGNPTFFYTRRIGRAPQGEVPDGEFTRRPEGTSILGAAKLTGKLGESWRLGMVHAVTAREYAEIQQGGQRDRVEVEPLAYYGVLRTQKEFGAGRQGLGVLATLTARSFDDDRLRDQVNSGALVLGLDGWTFLDAGRTWVATGWAGFSQVRGTAARITALQESSLHYFQRPDASHVEVDRSATSLGGFAARFTVNKQKGNVIFNSALGLIDPGFEVNDLGFSWRTDVINAHVASGYRWTKPGRFARQASVTAAVFGSRDFEGNVLWWGGYNGGYIEFPNYHSIEWFLAYNPASTNNRRTRGGPLTRNPPGGEAGVFWESDERKTWVFRTGLNGGRYAEDSQSYWGVQAGVEWKPAANMSLRLTPRFNRFRTASQWVDSFEDSTATATFGRRYVFADMEQTELSADTRLDWTFSPNLSLQVYMQPLFSAGDYENFKELARPGTYTFRRYGEDGSTFSPSTYEADPDGPAGPVRPIRLENPDFNFKSLRGNAVLRWEFRPGSTLYLVWAQTRSDSETIPEFRLGRSASRLWDAEPDNIFVVKMTYWWTP